MNKFIIYSGVITSSLFLFYFIFFHKVERGGKLFIISGMVIALYIFLYDFFFVLEYWDIAIWLYLLYFPLVFCIYPIIYHYLIYATSDKNSRLITTFFTYLPLLVLALIIAFYLPLDLDAKIDFIKSDLYSFSNKSNLFQLFQILIYTLYYLQVTIFISIFIHLYFIHKRRRESVTGAGKSFLPYWLFAVISVLILYEFFYLTLIFFDFYLSMENLEPISNLFLLLFLGFLGIKHDEMIIEMKLAKVNFERKTSHSKMPIDYDQASEIMHNFDGLIKHQNLYRNPGLKLDQIAKKIHIPPKKLSSIINKVTGNDFSNYINNIRIDEAIKLINRKSGKFKIEDIYLEVGYYTRSTFNRAFKAKTGQTPSEYIKNLR